MFLVKSKEKNKDVLNELKRLQEVFRYEATYEEEFAIGLYPPWNCQRYPFSSNDGSDYPEAGKEWLGISLISLWNKLCLLQEDYFKMRQQPTIELKYTELRQLNLQTLSLFNTLANSMRLVLYSCYWVVRFFFSTSWALDLGRRLPFWIWRTHNGRETTISEHSSSVHSMEQVDQLIAKACTSGDLAYELELVSDDDWYNPYILMRILCFCRKRSSRRSEQPRNWEVKRSYRWYSWWICNSSIWIYEYPYP